MLFRETGSPAKSLFTKTDILSKCFVFGIVLKLLVSRQHTVLVECPWFTHLLGQMCFCARKVLSASGHGPRSLAGRSVSCCIFLPQSWTLSSVIKKLVLQFLSRCACCFFVRVALNLCDDEWCVSQIRLDFPEVSSLICRHSEHTVQKQETLRIMILEYKCPISFAAHVDSSSEPK